MLTVSRRRPSWPLAWATWTSRWVSTPTVTRGRWGCAMVVIAVSSSRWVVDGNRQPGGRTALQRVWVPRLISGHGRPVGVPVVGRGASRQVEYKAPSRWMSGSDPRRDRHRQIIAVDEPTQPIDPHDPRVPWWSGGWDGFERCGLPERAVWPMVVVVRHIACQCRRQLPLAQDQHPVQQLTTDRADPPLRERVRPRRPHRCAQDPDASGAEDRVEAVGELCVPVADKEPELPDAVSQVHEQVAGLLRGPRSRRVCCHPKAVTPRRRIRRLETSITNSTYRRLSRTVSTWKKSHARMPSAWADGNCRQVSSARRGAGSMPACLRSSHTVLGGHPVAKLREFTVDAPIAPGRVLCRHPQDQASELRRQRRSAGWAVRLGPVATDQGSMPAQ